MPAGEGNEWLIYTGEPENADRPIARCDTTFHRWCRQLSHEEHTANARLMAAAPEMLDALQDVVNYFWNPDNAKPAIREDEVEAIVRAALAKARGSSASPSNTQGDGS